MVSSDPRVGIRASEKLRHTRPKDRHGQLWLTVPQAATGQKSKDTTFPATQARGALHHTVHQETRSRAQPPRNPRLEDQPT